MSLAAVERLDAAVAGLRAALETQDAETIERAVEAVRPPLDEVRAFGAWRADGGLKDRLRHLSAQLDSARALSRVLGDATRRRLDRFADRGGSMPAVYGRQG
jgi:hypothetical protein